MYTADLLSLEAQGSEGTLPTTSPLTHPSLPVDLWAPFLHSHPDQEFAAYIERGLRFGFHIGIQHGHRARVRAACRNHPSATEAPAEVSRQLASEVDAGRLRPITGACHANPLGLVPKSGNKWRLIVDMSAPHGSSVNDGIDPVLCSLRYAAVDQAVWFIRQLGRGALLAKFDLKSAYRMVPVHPTDHQLLGVRWEGKSYIDTALPFGLRSAPKIFSAVADMLAWAMVSNGVQCAIHYLDDFLILGPPRSAAAQQSLSAALATCDQLRFPVAADKTAGPSTSLVFLGILIDTHNGSLALPPAKLERLQTLLGQWRDRKVAPSKRELLSLLGVLSHAATVIRPGRIFTRNLFRVAAGTSQLHRPVRLNVHCRSDLLWWHTFARQWNGRELWSSQRPQVTCFTDASGSWGCGAVVTSDIHPRWCQLEWPHSWSAYHIACKEMVPVLLAAALWGCCWYQRRLVVHSDNTAAVSAIAQPGSARDPILAHLSRCLHFLAAAWSFDIEATHVPGRCNDAADALSRNELHRFFNVVPQATARATNVPPSLQEWLLDSEASWTSAPWRTRFGNFMAEVWQRHQRGHMPQGSAGTCNSVKRPG